MFRTGINYTRSSTQGAQDSLVNHLGSPFSSIGLNMAVYRFPLSLGVDESFYRSPDLPSFVSVMHAGESIAEAKLEGDAYVCDLSEEYAAKLGSGKLGPVFVYEPPLVDGETENDVQRELVSILLIGSSRREAVLDP